MSGVEEQGALLALTEQAQRAREIAKMLTGYGEMLGRAFVGADGKALGDVAAAQQLRMQKIARDLDDLQLDVQHALEDMAAEEEAQAQLLCAPIVG